LVYNQIGDEGAQWLSKNSTITTLDLDGKILYLGYNQIGDEGAQWLSTISK